MPSLFVCHFRLPVLTYIPSSINNHESTMCSEVLYYGSCITGINNFVSVRITASQYYLIMLITIVWADTLLFQQYLHYYLISFDSCIHEQCKCHSWPQAQLHVFSFLFLSFSLVFSNNTTTIIIHADEKAKVLNWLSPVQPHLGNNDVRGRRQDGLGESSRPTAEFLRWRDWEGEFSMIGKPFLNQENDIF